MLECKLRDKTCRRRRPKMMRNQRDRRELKNCQVTLESPTTQKYAEYTYALHMYTTIKTLKGNIRTVGLKQKRTVTA